ncbi:lmo0937 family membrane protein [Candidatus Daviesbacteria bacterium]|nr:lmo0937 family membrane protein [Candidatus Daviesbacteria bacterium]
MGLVELVALILLLGWIGGLTFNIAGGLIHILLLLAIIVFLLRFLRRII